MNYSTKQKLSLKYKQINSLMKYQISDYLKPEKNIG